MAASSAAPSAVAVVSSDKKKQPVNRTKKKEQMSLLEGKTLGHQLLSSRSYINNLPRLLAFIKPTSPPDYALESILSLHSFFTPLLPDLPPPASSNKSKPPPLRDADAASELIYRTWLRSNYDVFVSLLFSIAISSQSDPTLREVTLDTIMELVKVGNSSYFHSSLYHRLLRVIVQSTLGVTDLLLNLLVSNYFKYIDVRYNDFYFTYISLEKITRTLKSEDITGIFENKSTISGVDARNQSRASMELSIHKICHLLSNIKQLNGSNETSDYEMWNSAGIGALARRHNKENPSEISKLEDKTQRSRMHDDKDVSATDVKKRMKLRFSKAWLSFLSLTLPVNVYKEVLATLHVAVIPHLSNPVMLSDILTRSYDIGGVVSVMALSSLYILMTQHGLEYPNFHEKLYALLDPSIFMAKYRAKFFQLLDSCLKSSLLPAYLAAAFCKKLSRFALSVPPSGVLIIIALVHNLLRRHASINFLVHQEGMDEIAKESSEAKKSGVDGTENTFTGKKQGVDHFNDEEDDPIKTNAMRSSLWEIDTLRNHYCPLISRFVLSLENDLTVRAKTTEVAVKDFSSGSYATIFGEEMRRRVKQVPLAFYKSTPSVLFSEIDFPGWSFLFNDGEPVSINGDLVTSSESIHTSLKRQRVE